MIEHRPHDALGGVDRGWLKARLHVAFAGLGNPAHGPVGVLQAWNDDEFAPASGFPLHAHADMEIITYVRQGAVTHGDSLGNGGRIQAGELQVMSTGSGIRHSEQNLEDQPLKLFQIWIAPRSRGGVPSWQARALPPAERAGRLAVLASGDPADDRALPINADARLLAAALRPGETVEHRLAPGRSAYLVTTDGSVVVNGQRLDPGDGAAVRQEPGVTITALQSTEILLLDLV